MYWKYSLGFLTASLIQAGIIASSESLGISTLGAKITFGQLIIHVLTGQAAGFLLMVVMQGISGVGRANFWLLGGIYGAIIWLALTTINSAQGVIRSPWTQGISTITASLLAFLVYGIISAYTIKIFGEQRVKV